MAMPRARRVVLAVWGVVLCGLSALVAATVASSLLGALLFAGAAVVCALLAWWQRRAAASVDVTWSADGFWQDWVDGWYWETDATHALKVLKPDVQAPGPWLAAQQLVLGRRPLWACWSGAQASDTRHEAWSGTLAMLEMRLKAGLPVDIAGLPWPEAGDDGEGWRLAGCRVRGMPRRDAQGRFLGHQGVWTRELRVADGPVAVPNIPVDDARAVVSTPAATMTEAEQEVLRYALSHDLRAPLRVVDGFSRILKEDYGRVLDRIGNDHLDRVIAASARMNGMIDAILAQAQLSSTPIAREPIDLSAMARDVADEQQTERRGVVGEGGVEWVISPGLQAQGDPALVRRVLENLIGNALKYSSKVERPRIEVGAVPHTDPAVYFVRDNGAGFDMQHAEKLFGLFQRLHSHKEFPGTGVGLAGVQIIIRRHGGRVWAEAAPGQGACFYFTLSAAGPALTALPGRPAVAGTRHPASAPHGRPAP